jgi:uncharacterized membrane protein YecN with MAPEG domain
MPITAFYAGALILVFVALSVRVIGARRAAKVAVGDKGDQGLLRRMRAHGNFAEYVPLAVVLMGLLESLAAPALQLHAMGLALLVGRGLHAFGISRLDEPLWMRVTGMAITFAVLLTGAVTCMILAAQKLRLV